MVKKNSVNSLEVLKSERKVSFLVKDAVMFRSNFIERTNLMH